MRVCSRFASKISCTDENRIKLFCISGLQCSGSNNPTCCADRKDHSFPCSHAAGALKPCLPTATSMEVHGRCPLTPSLSRIVGAEGTGPTAWIQSRREFKLIPLNVFAWLVQRQCSFKTGQWSSLLLPIARADVQGSTGITLLQQTSTTDDDPWCRNGPIRPPDYGKVAQLPLRESLSFAKWVYKLMESVKDCCVVHGMGKQCECK